MEEQTEKKFVLVLGGSSFMGKDLLQKLSQIPNLEVHYINRGKTYWNNEVKAIPNLNYTYGDRSDSEAFTKVLTDLSQKLGIVKDSGKMWSLVVDFCAYEREDIESVYDGLYKLVTLYVFISTDSLYDVCDRNVRNLPRIVEEFAVRPKDAELKRKYKKAEDYGHNKMKCEEFLYEISDKQYFPFINLRLPDVLGPYDDTGRFWAYVIWILNSEAYPVQIEERLTNVEMSFVASQDVTDLIIKVSGIKPGTQLDPKALFLSYNIACQDTVTLPNMLSIMAKYLKSSLKTEVVEETSTIFPSVDCGPISSDRAISTLGWKPQNLEHVIAETVSFFASGADSKYPREYEEALKSLPKSIRKKVLKTSN